MDELELELNDENINKTEERIKNLSSKVRDTSKERDEANAKAESEATARVAAEKERDFYASFSDQTAKYPGAAEFKDAIREKVLAGYTPEDATVSVLNANGKLTPQAPQPEATRPQAPVAGGSAPTALPSAGGDKGLGEMTQAERRSALIEAQNRGDISLS